MAMACTGEGSISNLLLDFTGASAVDEWFFVRNCDIRAISCNDGKGLVLLFILCVILCEGLFTQI